MLRELRPVAVRAWTTTASAKTSAKQQRGGYVDLGPSDWTLTIDTETTVDVAQRLRFGTYQVRYRDRLREAGIFYEPEALTDLERETLTRYAAEHGFKSTILPQFIRDVYLRFQWKRRALVIGFNLPFDLSRIAIAHSPARPRGKDHSMQGGFSFAHTANKGDPRTQIKKIGPRGAFIRSATPSGREAAARNRARGGNIANHRGYFVDVATLAAALLSKKLSLAELAQLLGTATKKIDWPDHDTTVTAEYLEYAMNDAQVHWECFVALRDRYERMRLPKPIYKIYSEASIGKAHLEAMHIQPWREVQHDAPDWLVATLLETYYAGRCECHIRRLPVSGMLLDFASEYPTSFVLQNLHAYLVARGFDWHEIDPAELCAWIKQLTVAELFQPSTWKRLAVVVLVAPDDDLFPSRCRFDQPNWTLGVQRRVGGAPQWWTLADYVTNWLDTGHCAPILRAIGFTPREIQEHLQPINLAGDERFSIDPAHQDVVKLSVELRATMRHEADDTLDVVAAGILHASAGGLKNETNSIYGDSVEVNVAELAKPEPVTIHRPDGTTNIAETTHIEEPGRYFHPLLATLIPAGGRLLLALAMRLLADAGGEYVMCDTDSLFVAATADGS
jgi:hypothetical protein